MECRELQKICWSIIPLLQHRIGFPPRRDSPLRLSVSEAGVNYCIDKQAFLDIMKEKTCQMIGRGRGKDRELH